MGADGGIFIITEEQAAKCEHWNAWDSLINARKQTDPFGNTVYTFYSETNRDISFDDTDVDKDSDEARCIEFIYANGRYWEVWT